MAESKDVHPMLAKYLDGLDALTDGRGFDAEHEKARLYVMAALDAADKRSAPAGPTMPGAPIVFAVRVDGTDFNNDMSEAATWLESALNDSRFKTDVTAYRTASDAAADEAESAGAWKA